MRRTIRVALFSLVPAAAALAVSLAPARAADDPTIRSPERERIQAAMKDYVADRTVGGVYHHYDPVEGRLLKLRYDSVHDGIVRKGPYFVSCSDFVDQRGRKIDIDFLVIADDGRMRTVGGILHKIDGAKRAYEVR